MNYLKITALLLLLPTANYGNNIQEKINELEEAQVKTSMELAEITDLLVERSTSYTTSKERALRTWRKTGRSDSFDRFSDSFTQTLYAGKDIHALLECDPSEKGSYDALGILLVKLATEEFLFIQAGKQLNRVSNELMAICRKLKMFRGIAQAELLMNNGETQCSEIQDQLSQSELEEIETVFLMLKQQYEYQKALISSQD